MEEFSKLGKRHFSKLGEGFFKIGRRNLQISGEGIHKLGVGAEFINLKATN